MGATPDNPLENIYFSKLIKVIESKLQLVISNIIYAGVEVNYRIQIGNPFKTVAAEVAEEDVHLVVMGTTGAEGLSELLVGSNAEKVVRNANCPVITVNEKVDLDTINDIVFASNFHEIPPNFVERLKEVQELFDANLKLVKINTPAAFNTTKHDREKMEDFAKQFDLDNFSVDIYNYTNEEDGIVLFAEEVEADMIAIGTNQRKGLNHFMMGSIAEDVVNHSLCPVWTCHLDI